MAISRIESNSIAPSQTLTTPIIATTMGVGGATPAGSGSGITFPASQSASTDANTLDDYEKGTWTPVDNSGAGLSFSVATGFYTKIGRLVVANGQVQWPSTANGVTAAVSLPFASASTTANYSAGSAMNSANLTLASFVTSNVSYVSFYKQPLATFTQATNANLSTQYIYFTVTYFTA